VADVNPHDKDIISILKVTKFVFCILELSGHNTGLVMYDGTHI